MAKQTKIITIAFLAICLLSVIAPSVSAARKPCPMACTMDYRPICGSDGAQKRTFGNPCALEAENCFLRSNFRKISDGECPK